VKTGESAPSAGARKGLERSAFRALLRGPYPAGRLTLREGVEEKRKFAACPIDDPGRRAWLLEAAPAGRRAGWRWTRRGKGL